MSTLCYNTCQVSVARQSHISYATIRSPRLQSRTYSRPEVCNHFITMSRSKAHHRASCIALAVVWQLFTLTPSTHAQTQLLSTQDDPSDAGTRAPENDGLTGAPNAHFPCLSFVPVSTTLAGATSLLPFTLSKQQMSSAPSSSTSSLQSFNSTSNNDVSISTLYTTLRGTEQATSTSTPEQAQIITNGTTLSPNGSARTISSQNSTTDSTLSMHTTSSPKENDGATNATMFPVVLQTVTYTTTICPFESWV